MKKFLLSVCLCMCTVMAFAQKEITVKAGTLVPFQAVNTVKAADVKVGQNLLFRVARDIVVGGITAIPYGTIVNAKVLKAKKSSWWGTRGRLAASITEIVMPNGTVIPIQNGNFEIKGKNRTALSVILFLFVTMPACAVTGSKAELQSGYEIVGNVAANVNLTVE